MSLFSSPYSFSSFLFFSFLHFFPLLPYLFTFNSFTFLHNFLFFFWGGKSVRVPLTTYIPLFVSLSLLGFSPTYLSRNLRRTFLPSSLLFSLFFFFHHLLSLLSLDLSTVNTTCRSSHVSYRRCDSSRLVLK